MSKCVCGHTEVEHGSPPGACRTAPCLCPKYESASEKYLTAEERDWLARSRQLVQHLLAMRQSTDKPTMMEEEQTNLERALGRLAETRGALAAVARLNQWRHSPEWLENPSCRTDLNAAIDNALHIIAQSP